MCAGGAAAPMKDNDLCCRLLEDLAWRMLALGRNMWMYNFGGINRMHQNSMCLG